MPLPKVDEAVVEVMFKRLAASPPLKVLVELVPVTLRNPAIVDVPVVEVVENVGNVTVPVNTPAPVTESGVPGEVVPMPVVPDT